MEGSSPVLRRSTKTGEDQVVVQVRRHLGTRLGGEVCMWGGERCMFTEGRCVHVKGGVWRQIGKLTAICLLTFPLLSSCEQRLVSQDSSPLSLQECEELMTSLQEKYPVEYKTYDLSSVAVAIAFPVIKAFLQVSAKIQWTGLVLQQCYY